MSSAFARALAALHADPNGTVAATWSTGPARPLPAYGPIAFRGPYTEENRAFGGGVGGPRTIDIAIADLPAEVLRDDIIIIEPDTNPVTYKVDQVERDLEGLTWRVALRKA